MKRYILTFALLLLTLDVHAEPITAGTLMSPGGGQPVTAWMSGPTFAFSGVASPSAGYFGPTFQCHWSLCFPGTLVSLNANWTGNDFPGIASYLGTEYERVGSATTNYWFGATWFGSLAIPEAFTGGMLTAPFTFIGDFGFDGGIASFLGQGTVTISLALRENGSLAFNGASYDFEEMATNPEPATMLLLGSGLLVISRKIWSLQ